MKFKTKINLRAIISENWTVTEDVEDTIQTATRALHGMILNREEYLQALWKLWPCEGMEGADNRNYTS